MRFTVLHISHNTSHISNHTHTVYHMSSMSPKSNINHPVCNSCAHPEKETMDFPKAAVEGVSSAVKSECSAHVEVPIFFFPIF